MRDLKIVPNGLTPSLSLWSAPPPLSSTIGSTFEECKFLSLTYVNSEHTISTNVSTRLTPPPPGSVEVPERGPHTGPGYPYW